jgi:hypothetical protein
LHNYFSAQDVLFGRGPFINAHPGNEHLRSLVESQLQNWIDARKKKEKRAIAANICVKIQNLQPPGRFLEEVKGSQINNSLGAQACSCEPKTNINPALAKKLWTLVEQERAVEKILKRLRQVHQVSNRNYFHSANLINNEASFDGTRLVYIPHAPLGICGDFDAVQVQEALQVRLSSSCTLSRNTSLEQFSDGSEPTLGCEVVKLGQEVLCSSSSAPSDSLRWQPQWNCWNSLAPIPSPGIRFDKGGREPISNGVVSISPDLCKNYVHQVGVNGDIVSGAGRSEITLVETSSHHSIERPIHETNQHCEFKRQSICNKTNYNSTGGGISVNAMDSEFKFDRDADLCRYLDASGFDDDFFVQETTSQQTREYTLWQWIMSYKPNINFGTATTKQASEGVAKYIKSALLIALKLTECILEAEKDEKIVHRNPIPLASIASDNVLIRCRESQLKDKEAWEIIEFVWVMSFVGDDSATGTVMSRLYAVGIVFYELFSMSVIEHSNVTNHIASIDSISLGNEAEIKSNHHQHKKLHCQSHVADRNFNCISKLLSNGVPWSLCALVENLFECRYGSFCEDHAFASFADLEADLQLMVDKPSCFLDNIDISGTPKLTIPNKLYGREEELLKLNDLFKHHMEGRGLNGAIISGEAGVGKSKLALHLQTLTNKFDGYFLVAKFEQNQMSFKPLSTIANIFDSLCEMIFNDSPHLVLMEIDEKLASDFSIQTNLFEFVPNLRKLMPSCLGSKITSSICVDSAFSLRYLLGELLRVLSSHSKPITIVLDDVQFADDSSLLLIRYLLFSAQGAPIFFTLCHRDDETSMSDTFTTWLKSITFFSLEPIKLKSISCRGVNSLISEALHLSPRLTLSLSSALHCKTRGNPLFLRQLLDSLTEQEYIYIDLKRQRWTWDLDKVIELEISNDVLTLLMNDVQRLPSDLQFGLQIASCLGSFVTERMLEYLSIDLGIHLKEILQHVSQKGFMLDIAGSTMFRFAHDKIQQAVYEMMSDQQRRENHLRFGLALCTRTLNSCVENDELFFAAVNQINQGGPTAVHEPSQLIVFTELNVKAGKRSIDLCDYNTAFTLFQHGREFLGNDGWTLNYELSLEIHDALADAALILNKLSVVTSCSEEVDLHARCIEDKLFCKATKVLL